MPFDTSIFQQQRVQPLQPMNALLQGLQLQGAQQGNALQQAQLGYYQQEKALALQKAQEEAASRNALMQFRRNMPDPQAAAVATLGGDRKPTIENAARIPQVDPRIAQATMAFKAGMIPYADFQKIAYPDRKVKDYKAIRAPDGTVSYVGLTDDGQVVPTGQQPFEKPEVRDFGGYVGGIDPISSKVTRYGDKTMAPGEAQRIDIARMTAGAASRQAGAAEDANRIQREAQQSQIIQDPNLGPLIVNKGTKTAQPALMTDGKAIPGENAIKSRKAADQLSVGIQMARDLLPGATGSGVGALADAAANLGGVTLEGADKASQLKTLSGWLVANVPRMEGPQSNIDVLNYQQMAAQVGDETIPVKRRLAALDTLEAMQSKYSSLNGGAAPLGPRKPVVQSGTDLGGGFKVK